MDSKLTSKSNQNEIRDVEQFPFIQDEEQFMIIGANPMPITGLSIKQLGRPQIKATSLRSLQIILVVAAVTLLLLLDFRSMAPSFLFWPKGDGPVSKGSTDAETTLVMLSDGAKERTDQIQAGELSLEACRWDGVGQVSIKGAECGYIGETQLPTSIARDDSVIQYSEESDHVS